MLILKRMIFMRRDLANYLDNVNKEIDKLNKN